MNRIRKILVLSVCAVLALAALSSCSTLSANNGAQTTSVSISGNGTIYLKADIVTFSINVNETKATTAEAQQAANKKMTAILDILRKFGIEDDKILYHRQQLQHERWRREGNLPFLPCLCR